MKVIITVQFLTSFFNVVTYLLSFLKRVTVVKYRNCVNNTAYTYLKKSTPPTTKYTSLKPTIVHTKFSCLVPFFFFFWNNSHTSITSPTAIEKGDALAKYNTYTYKLLKFILEGPLILLRPIN